ncbi:ABC transporter ATP-binding protein [Lutispora sp.]|uniref:ABC transporter ATP-binding protein n=1 Tax=Lutispora sp. TaxID=2828727 RepID=UPI002B1F9FFB|nr:ABC transporter ATP-binding protein [Lutispora sp.]MEA4960213.1 ABC transporter ATP-binding protein [Lutispora sp.]
MGSDNILEIKNLSISYKDNKIIDDIDLDIKRGKIYSVIGPNGCGKTTLIRAMSRNIKPQKGYILLSGKNIFKTGTKNVARKMAVLYQSNSTMSDATVRQLVQYGRFAYKRWWKGFEEEDVKIVDWALEKTGLAAFESRKINTLSGGERQRAWIAMAIAQKPEILLLDEPTTFLDICHQLEIMELVAKLNREEGITIVMVLHDINHAARYSDELIVIKDHKIFKKGDPWTILKSDVLRRAFRVEAQIIRDVETNKPIFYAKKMVMP